MAEKQEAKRVQVVAKQIELPKFDPTPYIGRKARIVDAGVFEGPVFDGVQSYYLKLVSSPVDEINGKEICATRLFNLSTDAEGQIGWGSESKLAKFLQSKGVDSYEELLGREVIVQLGEPNKKTGQVFLSMV